jgi:hypothetical protein
MSGQSTSYPTWQNPQMHGYPGGQYPMPPYQGSSYYPPMHQSQYTTRPPPGGGRKVSKKDSKEDYSGLGKRDDSTELDGAAPQDGRKGGKKKKDDEKAAPKVQAKSLLKPPRQAQSMWQLFFADELAKEKEAAITRSPGGTETHAKLNVAQIAKDAGFAYNKMSDEQRKYYAGKVDESKKEYAAAKKIYDANLTPEDVRIENIFRAQQRKEGKSRKGNLKDPNAPKKPLSAYFLFLKGIRESTELRNRVWAKESETTKQSVLAAERWRSLSDDEKRVSTSQEVEALGIADQ